MDVIFLKHNDVEMYQEKCKSIQKELNKCRYFAADKWTMPFCEEK